MAINTNVDICNLALSYLGNLNSVNTLDGNDMNDKEVIFSMMYDVVRQSLIREHLPNFAKKRKIVAKLADAPIFGYENAYEYPADCLKVLGIGNLEDKCNDYNIGAGDNKRWIETDADVLEGETGLAIRYIADIDKVSLFDPNFKILLALELAKHTCLPITQDLQKLQMLEQLVSKNRMAFANVDSQESKPIRVERSKFLASKFSDISLRNTKK
jgi:hypothetical protein